MQPAHDDTDDEAACTVWTDAPDGHRAGRSQLQLAGLFCASCAGIVEQALLSEPGVRDARVSYASQRASVLWDPASTRLSSLLGAVRRAGYSAEPDAAAPARAMRQGEERAALWRLFVAAFCMMQVMMYQAPLYFAEPGTLTADLRSLLLWAAWLLSIPVVVFASVPFFRDAFSGLRRGRVVMDLPVALGVAITFVVSSVATFDPGGVFGRAAYFDSLTMFVTFLLGGRYLALTMRNRAASTLEEAATRRPDSVRRIEADGSTTSIPLRRLRRGDRIRVLAGDAFPADGPLVDGSTDVDESLLTGESRPVAKGVGDEAITGSINLRGAVVQTAERIGADTRYEGIVRLMHAALTDRPEMLRAADRIAGPFLWAVLALAAGAAAAWSFVDPSRAVWVAVSVLIVTCPCALSLAAPATLLAAASALVRRGVLVQRLDALEALAGIDVLCFDKTGTLTDNKPRLRSIVVDAAAGRLRLDGHGVRAIAASLAALSSHPLSSAIALAVHEPASGSILRWTDVREEAGCGIEARSVDGGLYRLGAAAWSTGGASASSPDSDSDSDSHPDPAMQTCLSGPDGVLATYTFDESLRPGALAAIGALQAGGLTIALLSGDATSRARAVAQQLGIARVQGDATPTDKLRAVAAMQEQGHRVGMIGDGLNDAPVMARADVSFAVGGGTALTRSKADFVLMSASLADIAWAREIARRAVRIVRQNLAWAVVYNVTCVPLALLGLFPPWAAGLGMACSSVVVVLNALRVGGGRPDTGPASIPAATTAATAFAV